MNITDAAYNTVHDYPGGASALAARMGIKSPAVLNSKVILVTFSTWGI